MSWYEVVAGSDLMQGDLLSDVQIPVIATEERDVEHADDLDFDVGSTDVVVISQSCDLAQKKLPSVIVASVRSWQEVSGAAGYSAQTRRDNQKKIRMGRIMHYSLLPPNDNPPMPWSVVDFRELYSVPCAYLESKADRLGQRLRLSSPYREELSQAFARYFMRVALPTTLEHFDNWNPQPSEQTATRPNA